MTKKFNAEVSDGAALAADGPDLELPSKFPELEARLRWIAWAGATRFGKRKCACFPHLAPMPHPVDHDATKAAYDALNDALDAERDCIDQAPTNFGLPTWDRFSEVDSPSTGPVEVSADQLDRLLAPRERDVVNEWLKEGRGVAVYHRVDPLPVASAVVFLSYGSAAANFKSEFPPIKARQSADRQPAFLVAYCPGSATVPTGP